MGSHVVQVGTEDNLDLAVLLLPSECWDYGCTPPLSSYAVLGMEPGTLGMLGTYSPNISLLSPSLSNTCSITL